MATGDQSDFFQRIRRLLPLRAWFPDDTPVLDAVIAGLASGLSYAYSVYFYAKKQTRLLTASDGWLDLMSSDYFGLGLKRKPGQTDASYKASIVANLFLEKGTRAAMSGVLERVTGRAPLIVEPTRPLDTGGYSIPTSGYGVAGAYGSVTKPFQAFVTVYRPPGAGVPLVAGYGVSTAGYSIPSRGEYVAEASILSSVSDTDIFHVIDVTKPAGTIVWVRIADWVTAADTDVPPPPVAAIPLRLDGTWRLDGTYTLSGER